MASRINIAISRETRAKLERLRLQHGMADMNHVVTWLAEQTDADARFAEIKRDIDALRAIIEEGGAPALTGAPSAGEVHHQPA